jgi:hypothetical protein
MSDKRNREIMAETGLCYTHAAREATKRRRTGRTLKDAFPDRMAQIRVPISESLREQMAQISSLFTESLREQMAQISLPVSTAFQDQMAQLAEQLATNAQQVRRNLASTSGVDEIERRHKAVRWFRALGHSIDDRLSEMDADTGHPRWQCQRCGSDLQLDGNAGWASSTGTGRCPHEGASW